MLVIPVGGGGGGGEYRFTEPTRIGQREIRVRQWQQPRYFLPYHLHSMETRTISSYVQCMHSSNIQELFLQYICIQQRQELFPPTYSACIPLIYMSFFPSTFALQCMHSSKTWSYFPSTVHLHSSTFAFHGDKNYFLLHTLHTFL